MDAKLINKRAFAENRSIIILFEPAFLPFCIDILFSERKILIKLILLKNFPTKLFLTFCCDVAVFRVKCLFVYIISILGRVSALSADLLIIVCYQNVSYMLFYVHIVIFDLVIIYIMSNRIFEIICERNECPRFPMK